jgi:hypothetical protein
MWSWRSSISKNKHVCLLCSFLTFWATEVPRGPYVFSLFSLHHTGTLVGGIIMSALRSRANHEYGSLISFRFGRGLVSWHNTEGLDLNYTAVKTSYLFVLGTETPCGPKRSFVRISGWFPCSWVREGIPQYLVVLDYFYGFPNLINSHSHFLCILLAWFISRKESLSAHNSHNTKILTQGWLSLCLSVVSRIGNRKLYRHVGTTDGFSKTCKQNVNVSVNRNKTHRINLKQN